MYPPLSPRMPRIKKGKGRQARSRGVLYASTSQDLKGGCEKKRKAKGLQRNRGKVCCLLGLGLKLRNSFKRATRKRQKHSSGHMVLSSLAPSLPRSFTSLSPLFVFSLSLFCLLCCRESHLKQPFAAPAPAFSSSQSHHFFPRPLRPPRSSSPCLL